MARTRRATTSPEEGTPAPQMGGKDDPRAVWFRGVSGVAIIVLLISASFLLQIYAPSVSQLLVLGTAGAGAGLLAMWPLVSRLLKWAPNSKLIEELMQKVSGAFGKPGAALGLALLALAVAPLVGWHRQRSARCPVLRIEPGGVFAYYLEDAGQAAKPPEKTFEIQVAVRDGTEVERFHPRDDGTIDIGASESVLRWRAAREPESKDAPKRSFLGTAHLRAGGLVTVLVLCRKSGTELFHGQTRVSGEPALVERFPLKPEDDDEFSRRMAACDPIQP